MLGEQEKLIIECLREQTTRTKTPVLAITFKVPNDKCESIPKPPCLSGIVSYEEDQTVIFHSNFAHSFSGLKNIFCCHLHL
jgi:hypothetical protein